MLFRASVILFLISASPVLAQDDAAAEVRSTIESQIDAFQRNDLEGAFQFASPALRGFFGTSQNFGNMVQQGYPMVWRPRDFAFLGLREQSGRQFQTMQITDQNGVAHFLEYQLGNAGGSWVIHSVRFVEAPDVGV